MNPTCPDCHTDLTPSLIGYLCHSCGSSHSFEMVASQKFQAHGSSKLVRPNKAQPNQKSSQSQPVKKPIHHKLKSFVVPEISVLPKPIAEDHLLLDHNISDPKLPQAPLGAPAEVSHTQDSAHSSQKKNPGDSVDSGRTATHDKKDSAFAKTHFEQQQTKLSQKNSQRNFAVVLAVIAIITLLLVVL